ncbi:hypothetical protein [Cupriavidus sp. EM10]|uniref:hypothetical protein n=1 Tax=Cupriavidus sp. EM10 TaxID=2839983 RepID=UPI001CED582F|nr:hypothetical protein [Cupriavidus sp. EM10]
MKIPKSFTRRHPSTNTAACQAIRRDACRVLRRVAGDMALRPRDFTIREHRQRRREVDVFALHTDSLLVEIKHPAGAEGGVLMSYRTCRNRDDLTGGRETLSPSNRWPATRATQTSSPRFAWWPGVVVERSTP